MRSLKEDIMSGTISYMRLLETDISVIKANRDAMIYNTWRSVSSLTDDYFSLKTQRCKDGEKIDRWENCEAYYTAFDYYDGTILKAGHTIYEVQ